MSKLPLTDSLSTPNKRAIALVALVGGFAWYAYRNRADALNIITPKSTYAVKKDISYGTLPRQKLDIYTPKKSTEHAPVLLFVHGGSWQTGSKDDYVFLGESFAREGFLVVVINYRLAPKHIYPDFVDDTASAIKWTKNNIANFGGNPNKLFVMGHSAGALNATAAVDDARFFSKHGIADDAVTAVIGVSGPYSYDFTTDSSKVAFAPDAQPNDIMPNRHVRTNPVPHLLLLAQNDGLVRDYNTHDMHKALTNKGGEVVLKTIPKTNHISIIAVCATRLEWMAKTKATVLDFVRKFL